MTTSQLQAVSGKLHGKAARPDGWWGAKLQELPQSIVTYVATWLNLIEREGTIPEQWQWARQAHIPKEKPSDDGTHKAENYDPSPYYHAGVSGGVRADSRMKA